jgi:hypothetical protein
MPHGIRHGKRTLAFSHHDDDSGGTLPPLPFVRHGKPDVIRLPMMHEAHDLRWHLPLGRCDGLRHAAGWMRACACPSHADDNGKPCRACARRLQALRIRSAVVVVVPLSSWIRSAVPWRVPWCRRGRFPGKRLGQFQARLQVPPWILRTAVPWRVPWCRSAVPPWIRAAVPWRVPWCRSAVPPWIRAAVPLLPAPCCRIRAPSACHCATPQPKAPRVTGNQWVSIVRRRMPWAKPRENMGLALCGAIWVRLTDRPVNGPLTAKSVNGRPKPQFRCAATGPPRAPHLNSGRPLRTAQKPLCTAQTRFLRGAYSGF